MSKDRSIICEHYERAGVCKKTNKTCTIKGEMQHCRLYSPVKGAKPFLQNNKKAKLNRAEKRERNKE